MRAASRSRKVAVAAVISILVFVLMQLFDGSHCMDCRAKVGFPFSYMQGGTYATRGHFIWIGFVCDLAVAVVVSAALVAMWPTKK